MTATKASKTPRSTESIRITSDTSQQVRTLGKRYKLTPASILDAVVDEFAKLSESEQLKILFNPKDDTTAG